MPSNRPIVLLAVLSALAAVPARTAEVEPPPRDNEPVLRIDPGAPTALVTSLAFSPDGKTLYAAGWDKVIRVWTLNDKGQFERSSTTYRVPIGPGLSGAINALALSPDGRWLAAAGLGTFRQLAGFRDAGFIVPAIGVRDPVMLRDVGTIYLFSTRDRTVRMLRGHQGVIQSLTFGPRRKQGTAFLLSLAAEEASEGVPEPRLIARLWDPDTTETRAVLKSLPTQTPGFQRPGLALWRSGEGEQVQAAFALHDSKLRLWDPQQKQERLREIEDFPSNLTVLALPGRPRLLTSSINRKKGQSQLTRWHLPGDGQPEPHPYLVGGGLVADLSLASREGDGTPDLAAALIVGKKPSSTRLRYFLRLIDLDSGRIRPIEPDTFLWEQENYLKPAVAASLHGEHVAVAGHQGHQIWVYRIASLLTGKQPPRQTLRGDTRSFQHASFVRRGKDRGLFLSTEPRKKLGGAPPSPDRQGDWIFDFGKRRLTDKVEGWQADTPRASDWRARHEEDGKHITVSDGEDFSRRIALPDKEQLSDYTLFPPGGVLPGPLLAVATHQNGQPYLRIYDGKSGEQLREFTGHKERLRSLAFSADGRLLVSSAEDGTVCVWSLTDLPDIVGTHGRLRGVSLAQAKQAVIVRAVEKDSPADGKLKPEDLLVGVVENGQLRRLQSPRAFYEALYLMKPGTKVVLRRGDPQGKDDVTLTISQGIDERKPLFSLFVSQIDKADSEWIGWSPLGPYDSSSPRADRYLGWHFNTGDRETPTRFAAADQYRKIYYREGILNRLLEKGDARGEAIRLPRPEIRLCIEESGQVVPDRAPAPTPVRRPRVDIKVQLRERPPSSLESLTWKLDDGEETPLKLEDSNGGSFTVPVSLTRGEHRFIVTARTPEDPLQPVHESRMVYHVPPRPEISLKEAGRQIVVGEESYTLKADIKPALTGEEVRVTLHHQHGEVSEKPHVRKFDAKDVQEGTALRFQHTLKLHPGNNIVRLVAMYSGAREDDRQEIAQQSLQIFYRIQADPPVIQFRQAVPFTEQARGEPFTVDASSPLVLGTPTVLLEGGVKADKEALIEAVWDRGKDTPAQRLDGFQRGKDMEITFREKITLKPGPQTIRFRARTKNSDEAERTLTLDYHPPVPVVRLTDPPAGRIFDGQEKTKEVHVHGTVIPPSEETHVYKVVLLVNGKPMKEPPILDRKAGVLDGVVRIEPGESRIQVQVSNRWGTVEYGPEIALRYVRPPIIQDLIHKPSAEGAFLNLTAEVTSWTRLNPRLVRVTVNGHDAPARHVRIERGMENNWIVHLLDVPLDAGSREQRLTLRVSNAEAECRQAKTRKLESKEVLAAPEVEFLEPRQNVSVATPRMTIRFQVRSETKLQRVYLRQEGRPDELIDLKKVRRNGAREELTAEHEVELRQGVNALRVVAISVSGRRPDSPQLIVSYVPPPLRVEIDHLTDERGEMVVLPSSRNRRGPVFPAASSGRVVLHGHIRWSDPGQAWKEDIFSLRASVNGFQQSPVIVARKANHGDRTPFTIPLQLTRTQGNHVVLLAERQESSNAECTLDCRAPITRQRLYVVALSGHSTEKELKDRIRKAIKGSWQEKQEPEFPIKTLTGSQATAGYLSTALYHLEQEMRGNASKALAQGRPTNDVVLIYYEGGERINDAGHFFEASPEAEGGPALGLPCDKLVRYLSSVPGAHVLLLDVSRPRRDDADPARDKIQSWEKSYGNVLVHVAVMRCARRGAGNNAAAVHLLPVLQRTIPNSGRLQRLVELVETEIKKANDPGLLIFKPYVTPDLADLPIGNAIP